MIQNIMRWEARKALCGLPKNIYQRAHSICIFHKSAKILKKPIDRTQKRNIMEKN